MNYNQAVANAVSDQLKQFWDFDLSPESVEALLEIPKDSKMGDIALPCFVFAKALKKAPPLIAKEICEKLESWNERDSFTQILALGPYLNFTINKAKLSQDLIPDILSGKFTAPREKQNTRVMVEYSQPNTHKAFHVGHTRNVALGDALVHLYRWSGYDVLAANYIGDVGTHIARCLWFFTEYFLPNEKSISYNSIEDIVKDMDGFREEITNFTNKNNLKLAEFLGEMYSQATDLLDFTNLATLPFPGIHAARIVKIDIHPKKENWKILQIATDQEEYQVVCGGSGYKVNDIVAFAPIGAKVAGRMVIETDKMGVESLGVVLSEKELNISDDKNKIFVFPEDTKVGLPIAEITKLPSANIGDHLVEDVIRHRESSVSKVLQQLELNGSNYYKLWLETKDWSMDEFYKIYDWLDVKFDHYFFESDVGDSGKAIVKEYKEKGVFIESEGATGVNLDEEKLPFFMVLKSDGTGLYSTKDLSLAQVKFQDFQIDKSIYVVDVGQSLHFQQVFASLGRMGFEQAKNCFHLAYGMVVLPDGKMSSRKGNVIFFSQLREALIQRIRTEFLDKYSNEWTEEEIKAAARKISIATIKYGMLNQDNNKNIVFDLQEWTSKSGNTGPYMLYAFARTRSILRELESKIGTFDSSMANFELLSHETEKELIRKMTQFPDTVMRATTNNEAQALCIYLYELSKDFSRMYNACSVLRAESKDLQISRACLVDACGRVIQKGLELIGIECLERM